MRRISDKQWRIVGVSLLWLALASGVMYTVVTGFQEVRLENLRAAQEASATKVKRSLDLGYFSRIKEQVAAVAAVEELGRFLSGAEGESASVSAVLRAAREATGAHLVYLLDREGECRLCVAAPRYTEAAGLMPGENFSFRPYHSEALQGRSSVSFARGVKTGTPGLYFSTPVKRGGEILGVVVFKAGTGRLFRSLEEERCALGVVDDNGVVIASNRSSWLYTAVWEVPESTLMALRESRQFEGLSLETMPLLDEDEDDLVHIRALSPTGWSLLSLVDPQEAFLYPQQRSHMSKMLIFLVLAMIAILLLFYTYQGNIRRKTDLRKLYAAVEQSPQTVMMTDTAGRIEYVNPSFTQLTGYRPEEVLGKTPRLLKSGEHDEEFYRTLWSVISSGEKWQGEIHNRRKDGSLYWEAASISPILDRRGRIIGYVDFKDDITVQKAHVQRTSRQARMDELTQTLNRRAGMEALQRGIDHAEESGLDLAVGFVDINGLKRVNDTYGHTAGDEMICRVAETIRRRIRSADVIARIGGDEFLVILPGCDLNRARSIWQSIQEEQEGRSVSGSCEVPLSSSAGFAHLSEAAESEEESKLDQLMNLADERMYRAKEQHKRIRLHHTATEKGERDD